jgi:DNA (cytosine-5)-methyltransferase 1
MPSGLAIRARRLEVGISQFKFAELAGVTSAVLSAWELGKADPKWEHKEQILRTLVKLEAMVASDNYVKAKKRGTGNAGKRRRSREYSADRNPRSVPAASADAPTVLAAFSGCGGMSEGFRMAGYSVEGFIEIVPEARATFALNFPGARCLGDDIRDLDEARLRGQLGSTQIDILAGGPPCQGFSLAGKRDRADPRNQLFRQLLKLADIVNPTVIVMENVRLLLSMKDSDGGLVVDRILDEMADHGFDATVNVVNAQDYGVPQFRERVIIIATNRDSGKGAVRFPAPTHGDPAAAPDLLPYRTFREATSDLAPLESGEVCPDDQLHWAVEHPEHVLKWLRPVPEGRSAHDNDDLELRPPSGYNTTYKRLRWDEPASTIGTTFGMISASRNVHPQYTRSLTVREAMRVQTFPDDFVFEGKWGPIRTMIGNAVPPLLATALARHLAESSQILLKYPACRLN